MAGSRWKRGKKKGKPEPREESSGEPGKVNQAQLTGASAKASKTVKAAKDMEKRAKKAGRRRKDRGNAKPKESPKRRTVKGLTIASKPSFRSKSGVIVRFSSEPNEGAKESTGTAEAVPSDNTVDDAELPNPIEVRVVQIFDELKDLNGELEKLPHEIFQHQNVQMLKGVIRSLDKDWKRFVESLKGSQQSGAKPHDSEPNPKEIADENDRTSNFSASVVSREESTSSRNHSKAKTETDPFDISRVEEDVQSLGSDSSSAESSNALESSNEQYPMQSMCSGPNVSTDWGSRNLNVPIQGKSENWEEFNRTGMWTPQFELPENSPRAAEVEPAAGKPAVVACKTKDKATFEEHMSPEEVQARVAEGTVLVGKFREYPKSQRLAFVSLPGKEEDILICGWRNRNRALHGDEVAVRLEGLSADSDQLKVSEEAPQDELIDDIENVDSSAPLTSRARKRDTGCVVAILSGASNRSAIFGTLELKSKKTAPERKMLLFRRLRSNFELAVIFMDNCPKKLRKVVEEGLEGKVFSVTVIKWPRTMYLPTVNCEYVGDMRDLETCRRIVLQSNNVQDEIPDFVKSAPLPKVADVVQEELEGRHDFRATRVFSIDPKTARDLDDALSITKVDDDLFEVSVHIADVSHFVKPDSAVDLEARNRATSVYLIRRVIPMLPRALCEDLCSLNPQVDRLSFSVRWRMDRKGNVRKTWFGKSVIRSCTKLSYEQAQEMIDTEPGELPEGLELDVGNGFKFDEVVYDVQQLHGIAQNLRKRRFDNGSITFHRSEMKFILDSEGNPTGMEQVLGGTPANHLVEEFMLLANSSVANFISDTFPDFATLRRHPAPSATALEKVAKLCEQCLQQKVNYGTSKELQQSMERLGTIGSEEQVRALDMLFTKPMLEAQYFCTGAVPEDSWHHYGLAVPRYTHFTSPIRRYPDVLVHRLLQLSIERLGHEVCDGPTESLQSDEGVRAAVLGQSSDSIEEILKNCNEKKTAAGQAEDEEDFMYLCLYLGPKWTVFNGVVVDVTSECIIVHVSALATDRQFFFDRMREQGCTSEVDPKQKTVRLSLNLQEPEQIPTDQKSRKGRRRRKRAGTANSADVAQTLCADETGKPATQLEEPISLQIKFLSEVKVLELQGGSLRPVSRSLEYSAAQGSFQGGAGDRRPVRCRRYKESDKGNVAKLFMNTVRKVNGKDYSEFQCEVWARVGLDTNRMNRRLARSWLALVAERGQKVVGFMSVVGGSHLDMMYVHHEHQREGIGRILFEHALECAEKVFPMRPLTVHASITARPFFESLGFQILKERILSVRGVLYKQFVMIRQPKPSVTED
ncbi:hypothetical protein NDN08_005279 [Rhodosorus marinus]|uniref:N-acetyltransferase domain-containing protein n=1 Tax=Rhodosorus marinus TaxID=101924 RepID=A0AAV8V2Y2_9RHOD|nr:hypothetical protein NDN08_005279 [Rhodosorus marinus]